MGYEWTFPLIENLVTAKINLEYLNRWEHVQTHVTFRGV